MEKKERVGSRNSEGDICRQQQRDNGVTMAAFSEPFGIIMITTQSTITAVNAGAIFRGNLKR